MNDAITLDTEEDLLRHYETVGEAWLALVGGDRWPYLLTSTEDGDVFVQTFVEEDNPGGSGAFFLGNVPSNFYPVQVVAAG